MFGQLLEWLGWLRQKRPRTPKTLALGVEQSCLVEGMAVHHFIKSFTAPEIHACGDQQAIIEWQPRDMLHWQAFGGYLYLYKANLEPA